MQQLLFQDDEEKAILITKEWDAILGNGYRDLEFNLAQIQMRRKHQLVWPAAEQMFNMYLKMLPQDIKVFILGQDPYPNENANGIAFSCDVSISPSLISFYEGLISSFPDVPVSVFENNLDSNMELLDWVEQGVFLTNVILTVDDKVSGSHAGLFNWENFTKDTIAGLAKLATINCWILLGSKARKYAKVIKSHHPQAFVLEELHPAEAKHRNAKWETDIFAKCNEHLTNIGEDPINWFKYY